MFLGAVGIVTDVAMLAVLLGEAVGGGSPLVDVWELAKALAFVIMLLALAFRIRLPGFGIAAALVAMFFLEATGVAGYRLGEGLAEVLDLTRLEQLIPAPPSSWGMLITLSGLTLAIGLTLSLSGGAHSPLIGRAGRVLALLMVLMFVFTAIWGLFGDAFPQLSLSDFATFGTLIGLSLAVAYTGGLLRVAGQWLDV